MPIIHDANLQFEYKTLKADVFPAASSCSDANPGMT